MVKSRKSKSVPCVSAPPISSCSSVSKNVSVCELVPYASTLMVTTTLLSFDVFERWLLLLEMCKHFFIRSNWFVGYFAILLSSHRQIGICIFFYIMTIMCTHRRITQQNDHWDVLSLCVYLPFNAKIIVVNLFVFVSHLYQHLIHLIHRNEAN